MTINAVSALPHIFPATPPPAEHEKSLASPILRELKDLQDLSRQLSESPHENGYLRYSKERGWKFSPNMSLRDTLHIRDAGYSDAPINPAATKPVILAKPGEKIAQTTLNSRLQALIGSYPVPAQKLEQTPTPAAVTEPVTLAKPGEKIALTTLNSRSQALIGNYPVPAQKLEQTPTPAAVTEPDKNLSPADAEKPTPAPRTVFFKASELNAPIPALRSSLPEISQVMDAYIQPPLAAPRRRASAPADLATPSVNALRQTFEAMGRA
ncbi:hypothetical protein J1G35_09875 [Pseudomonas sp. SH10-3B]|uniref:hypothetical protein n=1 Tax=Pseudomonas sp. SH10-3B TaxID=2816049 RepID=UPI001CA6B24E|nr:hypothetical protein [Pseudomonas sp. SH10-3B]MBY8946175.1 hypothetical protein [Pseudomonas sp. SH10-3B]